VSQDILNYKGKRRDSLVGTIAGAPIADAYEAPEFRAFVADYKKNFPDGYPSPSLFALVYYINMKAALDGLEIVKGDLGDGQKKYRDALSKMVLKTRWATCVSTKIARRSARPSSRRWRRTPRAAVQQGAAQDRRREPAPRHEKGGVQVGSRDEPNCP